MRIRVKTGARNIRLILPTRLIFSTTVARLGAKYGLKHDTGTGADISAEQLDALFAEFRRIKKRYGRWELVDLESSAGDVVKIIL